MIKGPKYREPRSINFGKAYFEIDQALEACIEMMSKKRQKNKLELLTLKPWKESALTMVKEKIKKLKQKILSKQTKPIFCDPDAKSYQEALHKRFAVITLVKAANNFPFIYKKDYISKHLAEVCLSNSKCKTY